MKITWREEDDNYVALCNLQVYPMRGLAWQAKKKYAGTGAYFRLLGTNNPRAGAMFLCRVDGEMSEEEIKGVERVARIRYAQFFEQE